MRETWLLDLMHWPGYNKVDSISTISYPVHCFAVACANYIVPAFQVLPSQKKPNINVRIQFKFGKVIEINLFNTS